jgi:hypothetical protein
MGREEEVPQMMKETHMLKTKIDTRNQIEKALSDFPGMISRENLAKFLGLSRRTLANKDSAGEGPQNPIRVGQRVLYEKSAVVDWLTNRAK